MSEDIVTRLEPVGYADPGSIRMMRAGHQERAALVRKEDAVLTTDDFQEADIPLFTADQIATTIATLRAELEAMRRDAERYRWLRDPNNGRAMLVFNNCGLNDAAELDASIDAAITKEHS